jgi:hypothetical protein
MQINIDEVMNSLSEQIAALIKDNAMLRVLVSQLESELDSLRASQVK